MFKMPGSAWRQKPRDSRDSSGRAQQVDGVDVVPGLVLAYRAASPEASLLAYRVAWPEASLAGFRLPRRPLLPPRLVSAQSTP